VRDVINRARYEGLNETIVEDAGYEVTKIDYGSFRRDFSSLLN